MASSNNFYLNNIQNLSVNCETLEDIDSWESKLTFHELLTVIHININSLKAKWDELCFKLQPVLPYLDVLIFTEIDVNSEEAVCYQLENFHQISKCRVRKGGGGGVMVFYRDKFEIENMCYNIDQADNIALRLTHRVHQTEWLILAIYRSPKLVLNSFLDDLNFWLENATKKTDNLIMIGDINICLKKRGSNSRYVNTLNNHTLVPLIQEYTREEVSAGNVTRSSIDHINVRMKREYSYTSSVITDKVADHYFVALRVSKIAALLPTLRTGPVYREIPDNKLIQQKIEAIDWAKLKNNCENNPHQLYEEITKKFDTIYETSIRKIEVRDTKYHTPWVNERVKNEIELKRKLLKLWQNNKNNLFNWDRYKQQRNLVTNLIKKQKRIYTYKVFKEASGNMKKTWSLINCMMDRKKKDPIEDVLKKNFQTNDLLTLSNQLNKNFIDQIINIKIKNQGPDMSVNMSDFVPHSLYSSMYLRKARMADINAILKSMKQTGKGIDGLRNGDIIKNAPIFVPIITDLVNSMITEGVIPDGLKISCVSPLYKNKGKADEMINYRPVGSMPLIEKVLEKHINIQMKKYLAENEILPDFQHGFQSGKSTTTLLQDFADLVNTALDERKCVVILLLDLSFAFDALEHSLLLEKFKLIGITHPILTNFFFNRKQLTRIGDVKSELIDVNQGLCQGGINSPTWFNVYTYDIQHVKRTGILKMFADDSCIVSIHKDVRTAVTNAQADFIELQKYFYKNSIFLNEKKTEAMVLGFESKRLDMSALRIICHSRTCLHRRSYETSVCSCHRVDYTHNARYLGVFLDDDFKMKQHADTLARKLRVVHYKMKKINAERMPFSTKKVMYFSLVDSLIRYGVNIYSFAPQTELEKVCRVQRKIKKLLFWNREDVTILTPDQLYKLTLLTLNFHNSCYRQLVVQPYNLRQQDFYRTKLKTFTWGRRRLDYIVPQLLNTYCQEFIDETNKRLIKKNIKDSLVNNS